MEVFQGRPAKNGKNRGRHPDVVENKKSAPFTAPGLKTGLPRE
jgi:hypothetical protein